MPLSKAWRDLHQLRFRELPLDCGNSEDPGIVFGEDLRDWSDKATTPDQRRMESYIDRYDLRQTRILHIGIGNSGLARRFHKRVKTIVGTTIDDPEIKVAQSLGLPNYSFVLHNKYSGKNDIIPGRFDFILDNNPTSPCCCIRHLAELFSFYEAKVEEDGQIVTDFQGLQWIPEHSNPRWSFSFDDLAAAAAVVGFSAYRMNKKVLVLSRSPPPPPGLMPRSLHVLRRLIALPGKIARHGPQLAARYLRRTAKVVVRSTLPWLLPTHYRSKK